MFIVYTSVINLDDADCGRNVVCVAASGLSLWECGSRSLPTSDNTTLTFMYVYTLC